MIGTGLVKTTPSQRAPPYWKTSKIPLLWLGPGLGWRSRIFLAHWEKIGAGATWEKNREPEPNRLKKKNMSLKKIYGSPVLVRALYCCVILNFVPIRCSISALVISFSGQDCNKIIKLHNFLIWFFYKLFKP